MHNAAENKMKRGEKVWRYSPLMKPEEWREWNLQLLSRRICVHF